MDKKRIKNCQVQKSRLLLIDDNRDILISLKALIESVRKDLEFFLADSGSEGILKAESEKPDVILLDLNMTEMDGYEVISVLKSNPDTQYIPIIVLTGISNDPSCRFKAIELGADAFLTKPIDQSIR